MRSGLRKLTAIGTEVMVARDLDGAGFGFQKLNQGNPGGAGTGRVCSPNGRGTGGFGANVLCLRRHAGGRFAQEESHDPDQGKRKHTEPREECLSRAERGRQAQEKKEGAGNHPVAAFVHGRVCKKTKKENIRTKYQARKNQQATRNSR